MTLLKKTLCLVAVLAVTADIAFAQQQRNGSPAAPAQPLENAASGEGQPPGASSASSAASPPGDDLSIEQARLADRYKRLEEVVGRLAEISAASDPRRAKLLRETIAQSREQDISVRFEAVVKLLQDERLSAATKNQADLQTELDGLLALLLKADRDNELNSQRDRVKKYLQEVSRLIRDQKSIRARTEEGGELDSLGKDQLRVTADTAKLSGDIAKSEQKGDATKRDESSKSAPADEQRRNEQNERDNEKPGAPAGNKNNSDDVPPGNESSGDKSPNKPDGLPNDKRSQGAAPRQSKDTPSGKPSEPGKPTASDSSPGSQSPSGEPGQPGDSQPTPTPGQEGKPTDGQSKSTNPPAPKDPADRATEQLKKARQQMEEAQQKLAEAEREGAAERQLEAIKQLEQAKAELERVLRQLREEELERTLTQLAARFRKMLEMQTAIYDGTVRIDKVVVEQRTHDHEIEAARLSREESQVVHEVEKALSLLHEEGSSVAFPEAIDQMRDDMRLVAGRLAVVNVDQVTQGIEQDIIAALEETIAALDKSIKDLEKKRSPPGQQPMAGQPEDMPLVDKLAELKMIRSLQVRINKRTKLYGEMAQGDYAETPELLKSLQDLAERQQRVYRATADLQQKRND